jgi:hypothetical protein
MIKEQKKRKTMNLPIRIVKRINEEAYRKWKSSSAIALSIIEENCDYVLSLSALPPVDKTSKDLKTSFRPLLPKDLTDQIESKLGKRQFTHFFLTCCDLYFSDETL